MYEEFPFSSIKIIIIHQKKKKKTSLRRHENDPNIGQGGRMEEATRE
jgi:hypothetical protein